MGTSRDSSIWYTNGQKNRGQNKICSTLAGMTGDALRKALAEVLRAVPIQPPLSELSVWDVVNVDESTGAIKRSGKRIPSSAEVQYTEVDCFDKHLVECGQWSEDVAAALRLKLKRCGVPVDLAIADEEVESVNENMDSFASHLKPRTGVVVRVVSGRLEALCEQCDEDAEGADYLTSDDTAPLLEIPVCEYGVIGADVVCMDDDGKLYRLADRLFHLKSAGK